ncbi:NAD-dependent epimerase/dehydratase family protein [Aliarcobacter cryaerophilus]|uniref:NAD-dependent epimerase/dehydratase family protein n=1 Tax=Aliarcobacter cryaerophilus TaxID=28198 RepID=UPI0021B2A8DA|nr:NAD-dependent epimerase/dehydratase family protein [Aliarcobacter cryaerophilus]MCT7523334.1 NAD-dependent epimerase/dehydratase family protein [Aliarcobacter cryaerophilus]
MKKLLITGSNGFVGKYFINKYKNKYEIKTFSFLKDDINSLDCSDIDVVFHLSALVHQMGGASCEEYERVNVTQTLQLAKKAKESGIKQFIFMSTVAVYGIETGVMNEKSDYTPLTEYGKSKLRAEIELQKLENKNFKVSIIRPPIVYGKNAPGNMKSLLKLINKVPLLPFGKIENKRSMVYIGNLSHLVNEVIIQKKSGIFLASDDEPLSTTRLIELMAKNLDLVKRSGCGTITLCDKKVYLVKIPFFESLLKILKPSFHKRLYGSLEVDNTITKQKLNLQNPYSVEDGIKLMINGE